MKPNNCRLRAMGMTNALGASVEAIWPRVLRAEVGAIKPTDIFSPGRPHMLGVVSAELPALPSELSVLDSRNSKILLSAFNQIRSEVEAVMKNVGSDRVGVVIGTSTSGIEEGEIAIKELVSRGVMPKEYNYSRQEIGAVAELIACLAKAQGPAYTVSTACSSSAKVFRSALTLLESELCDAVIVGGGDALCGLTVNGFAALELLAPGHTNPFSKNRNGINLGEGACVFLLTREEGGVQLLGVGESSDAYHMSSPDPEAYGAVSALSVALAEAQIGADDVDYLNLHGTGTMHNDAMEAKALKALFRADLPCSSTKPMVGHTLGASGATEIGFCWMLLKEYLRAEVDQEITLPPHIYDGEPDPVLPALALVGLGQKIKVRDNLYCVSNSFGFGGSNCAVVLGASLK